MVQRLYLHIGTPKSATTYVQDWCEKNARALAERHILWPTQDRYATLRDFLGTGTVASDDGCWASLCEQIRAFDGSAIFSNERLVTLGPDQIQLFIAAIDASDVTVIVTARDLARVIPSQWQTAIRNGGTAEWGDFADGICAVDGTDLSKRAASRRESFWMKHDLAAICQRWSAGVPRGTMTVVTVPQSGSDPNEIARRFGSAIGVQADDFSGLESSSNASLGAHSAELMRRLNLSLKGADRPVRKAAFRDTLGKTVLSRYAASEPPFALAPDQLDLATRKARTMVQALDEMGVQVSGDLTDLIPKPWTDPTGIDPSASSDADLLQAASRGLIGLLHALGDPSESG